MMTRHVPTKRRLTMNAPEKTFSNSKVEIHNWVSASKITCPDVISRWAFSMIHFWKAS
jgi:hypothetical protein